MNIYNDYSVWRVDHDHCSDESGHSAEYKVGVQHHRLLEEAEEERDRAKTIHKEKCQGLT